MLIRIVAYFLENPYEEVYLRELAKKLKLSPFVIKKYADILVNEGIIQEERKANLRYFRANMRNLFFKHLKIAHSINMLTKSGLIHFLKQEIANLSSIVLFGSMAKGEDDRKSDVDLIIIGKEKHLPLSAFEEKIGKKINEHTFLWSRWNKEAKINRAFYFDVIAHGIPLHGELPIVM